MQYLRACEIRTNVDIIRWKFYENCIRLFGLIFNRNKLMTGGLQAQILVTKLIV